MPELLHPGVYVREVPSGVRPIEGVSTSTAAFIGVADKGPVPGTLLPTGRMATPVMVTSFTDYLRQFGGFREDSFLTYAVQAFFNNGGRRLYVVRIANLDAARGAIATRAHYRLGSPPTSPPEVVDLQIDAVNEGEWGNKITMLLSASSDRDPDNFKLVVQYDNVAVETYDNITYLGSPTLQDDADNPAEYGRTVINSRSEYIAIVADFTTNPTAGLNSPPASPPQTSIILRLAGGADGNTAVVNYIGSPAPDNTLTGTGLYALDKITDVNLIAIPGQGDAATVSHGMNYCKTERPLQDCFFIGDMGTMSSVNAARRDDATPDVYRLQQAIDFATTNPALDKSVGDYGALYFPWVWATDPIGKGRNPRILLPPSGFLAGLYARIDNSRGVFKAPAGTGAGVAGALAAHTTISDTEQDRLNPIKVNVVRTVPGTGLVVWGTRTIGSDPEWRYIPVRRIAIFLRVSIYYGIQWAVFEPNDEPLWASLRLNIRAFMLTQFRAGAFQGSKPDDAFFVKCDSSTTTQQDIDNGVVNILVGFAPLKPAEFVVLQLQQKVNQPQ
jgi:Bacteriophage tail sheath protein